MAICSTRAAAPNVWPSRSRRRQSAAAQLRAATPESIRMSIPTTATATRAPTRMLERAEKVIPLGSQTFSKSRIQYPQGQAPLFLTPRARRPGLGRRRQRICRPGLRAAADRARLLRSRRRRGDPRAARQGHHLQPGDRARDRACRAADGDHSVRGDGAVRQERLGRDLGLRAHRARRDRTRPHRRRRLSRLAGLVHRRDHAQQGRARRGRRADAQVPLPRHRRARSRSSISTRASSPPSSWRPSARASRPRRSLQRSAISPTATARC